MQEIARCPECGSPLAEYWPKGLCPRCAFDGALDEQTPESPAHPKEEGGRSSGEGKHFGDYELLEEVARGGMGVVYRARQVSLNRIVALKMILAGQFASKQEVLRFRSEAEAAAHLQHPNIVRIHETGERDGHHYFSMDFVEGQTLSDIVRDGPLPAQRAAKYACRIAEVIHYAHSQGVLHRDLKPSNVVIDSNDEPRITDFGLAKRMRDDFGMTVTGQVLGSPNFMPPEQTSAKSSKVGPTSDVYGIGALLYHLLTSRPPFQAETIEELLLLLRDADPVSPRLLNPSVPRDLETICLKCLEKDPARRYPTAQALADELSRFLRDEPIEARPAHALNKAWRWCRRRPALASLSATAALATVLAVAVLVVANVRITREKNQKESALNEKGAALTAAQVSEQHARDQLFSALKSQAQARRFSRQAGQRLDSLAAVTQASRIRHDPSLADDAVAAMALADIRLGPVRKSGGTNSVALAFDASFERCAFLDHQGLITVRSVIDDRELQRLKVSAPASSNPGHHLLTFSPDGNLLGYVRAAKRPYVWRLADAQEILHDPPRDCSQVEFSPDSRQLIMDDDNLILSFDPATGHELRRWRANDTISMLAFAPDNRRFAASYITNETISVFDVLAEEKLFDLPVGPDLGNALCWHPDGQHLAMGGMDPNIQIWNLERRRRVAILTGHYPMITGLAFHPGGDLLVSSSWDATERLWEPASARQIMQLPIAGALQFGADGRWLGAVHGSANQVQLLEVTPPREYRTIVSSLGAGQGEYLCCAVSPDNQLLAVGMGDGVRIWNLFSHGELVFLEIGMIRSVAFTADNRALLTSGTNGVKQWPIEAAGAEAAELSLGPPQNFRLPFPPQRFALSRDSRILGVMSEATGQAAVLDLATAGMRSQLMTHPNVAFLALSLDARWLATSGWHSDRVRLWNVQTGKLAWENVVGNKSMVFFTPDSRQLVIAMGGEFTFYDLTTFEATRRLPREPGLYPGDIAFTADGKLMAMEMSPAVIHLKEVATGKTIAKLEDPCGDRSTWMTFTPDATKLIVVAGYAKAVHIWDLRAIRSRLKEMGLDWDWPEFPPLHSEQTPLSAGNSPLRIKLITKRAGDPDVSR